MEATLSVLNSLVDTGLVEKYAIGGAVAAIFWVEPFDTIDLDIFVLLPDKVSPLDPLRDVFERLKGLGYAFDGEFMVIEGVPVQFLPAEDPTGLQKAALECAVHVDYKSPSGTVGTWVLTPEYLIALALQVHRSKDYDRVFRLLSDATVDNSLVGDLIARYHLKDYWDVFLRRYPEFVS